MTGAISRSKNNKTTTNETQIAIISVIHQFYNLDKLLRLREVEKLAQRDIVNEEE